LTNDVQDMHIKIHTLQEQQNSSRC